MNQDKEGGALELQKEDNANDRPGRHPVDTARGKAGYFVLAMKGFCMGVADIIPGISGGTIAFILGIYEDLITAIRSFDVKFLKNILKGQIKEACGSVAWRFLFTVITGILSAIIILSRLVSWLLAEHPVLINSFFFGLIIATVPVIAKAVGKWSVARISALFFSAVGTFFFVQIAPVSTPETHWFVFTSGALAICAMILPGISGAFILLLLGKYEFILNAIHSRDLVTLMVFASGIAVGILTFVRILGWLFRKYHDMTIAILAGFVLGSLNRIWPWKSVVEAMSPDSGQMETIQIANILPQTFDTQFFAAMALIAVGAVIALLFHLYSEKNGK